MRPAEQVLAPNLPLVGARTARFKTAVARRFVAFIAVCGLLVGIVQAVDAPSAEAVTGANFQAGYIISDDNFYTTDAMSQTEIQSFLDAKIQNTKIGACQNTLCLNVLRINTVTTTLSFGTCKSYVGEANESAARMIYKVQQACAISAKVLLATLEKEQGLVTSTAPTEGVLRKALGQGCPDTAQCDSAYYGFFMQVYSAARQFAWYGNPEGSHTSIKVGQSNAVRFHPNIACGSSNVVIQNRATAALYYYTPYQPNAAALANMYGTGDACSAYGNRNFWQIYSDWFGSPTEGPDTYIEATYQRHGGQAGYLGAPVTNVNRFDANGGGYIRGYANGAIAWSYGRGAFVLTGDIRAKYGTVDGIAGPLGWPASDPNTVTANGGGVVQSFHHGAIVSSTFGTWILSGNIRSYFGQLGGLSGAPGWATGSESCTSDNVCSQPFQGGTIYWVPLSGGKFVPTAIRTAHDSAGGADGALGLPVSGANSISGNGGGIVQSFVGGAIAWSASGGAHALVGGIRTYFNEVGGIAGAPGWPAGDQTCASDGTCSQVFQGGTVYWTSSNKGAFVDKRLAGVFDLLGGPMGELKLPTTSTIAISGNGGGIVQAFQNGAIAWSSARGAHALKGGIRTYFNTLGGIDGLPGWPTTDETCVDASNCTQTFQGGRIYWTSANGGSYVDARLLGVFDNLGGPEGSLGQPTTSVVPISSNGGGIVQAFTNGAIAWSASGGAHALSGGVRSYYDTVGGIGGSLGWPTGDQDCSGGATCTQAFAGGTIFWSAEHGGSVVSPPILAGYLTAGGPTGVLGWSTGRSVGISTNGGGIVQAFTGGAIASSSVFGPFAISGDMRTYFNSLGGISASIGWPTSVMTCDTGSTCTQGFQGGTLVWTPGSGGTRR